jgi:DNA-binding HxlR family transcriptional regulator
MAATPIDPTSPSTGCPLTAALAAIGGKWNLICLYWLSIEVRRFGELRRLMPGISHKVLAATLRDLEREGLITRTVKSDMPAHVDYAISEYGKTVLPLIDAVRAWGHNHLCVTADRRRAAQATGPVDAPVDAPEILDQRRRQ